MAVIHFKTRGGLKLFSILFGASIAAPLINTTGVPAYILAAIISAFLFYVITIILNGGKVTPRGEYEAAVKNSSGVERLRLKASNHFIENLNKKDNIGLTFPATYSVSIVHLNLTGVFYNMLKNNFESTEHGDLFEQMSDAVTSSEEKELIVASRLFGIAFGIVLEKASDLEKAKIKKNMVKSFLDVYMPDNVYKKEFSKAMTFYLDLKGSDTKTTWASLEKMTYALMDAKIKRDKDDIADPIVIMPLKTALAYARNSVSMSDHEIKELKDRGLIA